MSDEKTIEDLREIYKSATMSLNYGHEWTPDTDELIHICQTIEKAIEIIQTK